MWYELTVLFDSLFGGLFGSKSHYIKQLNANKPAKDENASFAVNAANGIAFSKRFEKRYWRKAYIIRCVVVLAFLMLITNPSLNAYKEHVCVKNNLPVQYFNYRVAAGRKYNLFLFSVYQNSLHQQSLGVLGNFFDI
jgi:hypothetical protein